MTLQPAPILIYGPATIGAYTIRVIDTGGNPRISVELQSTLTDAMGNKSWSALPSIDMVMLSAIMLARGIIR